MSTDPSIKRPERRASERFSIDRRIRYRVVNRGVDGIGKTVNMSSVGVLIATDHALSLGWQMEVEVEGPFHVDDQVFSKLLITGRIVRTEISPGLAALKIISHEFRTIRDST